MRRPIFALAASVIAITCGGASKAAIATGERSQTPSVFWGAYVGGAQHGFVDAPWDMRSVRSLETALGKRLSLIEWGQDWHECSSDRGCGLRPFRSDLMNKVRARGAIPVLSWGSYVERGGATQPDYSLSQIISGRYDSFIRDWAAGAKAWGHPFFLRFDWEMNTNSVPYSEHSNGNRPGEFVRMWRHVHDIFTRVGAGNVTWVWCPNVDYAGSVRPLARLYPGDRYVDWTCLDGYNWGTNPARPQGWLSFARVFGPTYRLLAKSIAPGKPVMIGETASTEVGGSKAAWIAAALAELPRSFPRVKALVWFDKTADGMDWPIGTSHTAFAAFARGIRSPRYAAGAFSRLSLSPIRPLGAR
jgi:hypothetical protein